ncbi:MAG: Hsp20/alpha crystallin family protein [Jaaginema sp. PMC 1079.18]|nr:Hsp20/alpha crystallin family protein [Jaaginema sp. PMC 1080.18]MEC4850904.1 Hsp20/alpha crystallin family protein [Jaaginema sp. PMC 1079.18]MEC4865025.1 Hsp20/alpha crystallin family protein [Jaaginema sp. PMC 1078.18]
MAIVRFQPFSEIDSLQREMNRIFESITDFDRPNNYNPIYPAVELHENEEAIVLKLEVPGMKPEDLDIQATAEAVVINGERKTETKTAEKGAVKSEFRYGRFRRVIPLSVRIQNTQVTAAYTDGILTLTLPKAEEERNKVVKVNLS